MADSKPDKSQAKTADSSRAGSVEAMTEQAMREVESAAGAIKADLAATPNSDSFSLPDFARPGTGSSGPADIRMLGDVELRVTIELGRTNMYVEDVLRLNESSVIELDKAAGDPVDIYVNDRHVARGEVLVLNENFCVRVSELVQATAATEPAVAAG
jgi:flagellar motor switch protein FliN/FliY